MTWFCRLPASLMLGLFLWAAIVSLAQQPANMDVRPLVQGKAIARELRAGESQAYEVSLAAGEFLQVTIASHGIDLMAASFAPDGTKLGPWVYSPTRLKEAFDAIVFFETTTRARPNPSVKNVAQPTDQ